MAATDTSPAFEALLEHLKRVRGFDFTGYKRSSLVRRIDKRIRQLSLEDYTQYLDYLEVHPEEFAPLFDTILINVTGFFRDPESWEKLAKDVIPEYVINRRSGEPIRVWSAGCASAEEAYTLAMIFADVLGPDAFRDRLKIYATDVDENALTKARHAAYQEREVGGVPLPYREQYFEPLDNGTFCVRKDLRRQVIFGRHDLVQDAPISRIDLLACRNTLMYFNAETQSRVLARFHFALNDGGVLFLGRAETMLAQRGTFAPVDLKRRISVKLSRPELRERHSNQELETAYEELQSTNEELETTNEELQSTVEELETTNEELQSTNEELETMNEELQSTNEELQTINEELRTRSEELNDVNAFMESILASLRGAVVVVDHEYKILIWNNKAEDLWGLRRDEVEAKNFSSLDIGLPVHQLKRPMRLCLTGESDGEQLIVDATNRRGKSIQCLVSCMALLSPEGRQGVIVTMEQVAESLRRPLVPQDGDEEEEG